MPNKNVFQPYFLKHENRWVCGFGGSQSQAEVRAICAERNAAIAAEKAPKAYESYENPTFAIGGINAGDGAEVQTAWPQYGRRCKVCGEYESIGARFTTLPESGICDDCL